jgi:SAM-dependent methyltransferase
VPEARYDKFAERYAAFADEYGDAQPHPPLPADIAGQRVLDLACGTGRFARHVARTGAHVVGVDLSAKLIDAAQARGDGIDYLVGDAASVDWWDGRPFDGVTCHMALMDIDDLDGALDTVTTVLRRRGWFTWSVLHPCNPGAWTGSPDAASSWPPDKDYATEGWWTTGADGVARQRRRQPPHAVDLPQRAAAARLHLRRDHRNGHARTDVLPGPLSPVLVMFRTGTR